MAIEVQPLPNGNGNGIGIGISSDTGASTPKPIPMREPKDIECWGHRGASAHLPENTLASFRAAIAEGADGIESDVHATSDGVVLMFHDPTLDRTTTGTGLIRDQPWKGSIENVRTKKEPIQPIPLFEELIELIMEEGNRHVVLNIDCKMQNDPERLFPEMARIISQYDDWQTLLAPRVILGLWHPLFLRPAFKYLPLCTRYHIGFSVPLVRKFFWDACQGFSICFPLLMGQEGQQFLRDCRDAGKEVCVWTVNNEEEMRVAMSWGVRAVLTDRVGVYTSLKKEVVADPSKLVIPGMKGSLFAWSHWRYYSMAHVCAHHLARWYLNAHGDMLSSPPSTFTHGIPPISTVSTVPTIPILPDFSTASTSYVPTLAPAVSTTTSPEILPTTPATPPPIGPGPAGTSGDIGVAHVAPGPGARRKPSISERVVDAVAPETFTAFSGTSPE